MLRRHHSASNFWEVPAQDRGDLGIEFFTSDGTIYQCYKPDSSYEMSKHKRSVQQKINDDLKKLKEYESQIEGILGGIRIKHWVLLIPEVRSKDLLAYCNKKRNEVLKDKPSFVDSSLKVKIETADIAPDAALYAHMVSINEVDIEIRTISEGEKELWTEGNSSFTENITRKTSVLGTNSEGLHSFIVQKYLEISGMLDSLRDNYPDLYMKVEHVAAAKLEHYKADFLFSGDDPNSYLHNIMTENREVFSDQKNLFSPKNLEVLAHGYMAKWITECFLDFINE